MLKPCPSVPSLPHALPYLKELGNVGMMQIFIGAVNASNLQKSVSKIFEV
jgi:hypothetical protein